MTTEQPDNLLVLVLQQHYQHQPDVLESANQLIKQYRDTNVPNYEKTLSTLYQMLSDLPSDVLLYFLTTVPLPQNQDENITVLQGLMKQMLCPSYHVSMQPVLLKYLNKEKPPLDPATETTNKTSPNDSNTQNNSSTTADTENPDLNIRSVIDDNIRDAKNKNKKGMISKNKRNYDPMKYSLFNVKSLTSLCALNFAENHNQYFKSYNKQRKEAWKLVNSNKVYDKDLSRCYDVIRDINKKIEWLLAFQSGRVSLDIIKNEYGNSDVFYLEKHLQHSVSENVCNLNSEVQRSIDIFLKKC